MPPPNWTRMFEKGFQIRHLLEAGSSGGVPQRDDVFVPIL